jgi:hypothetical protein
MSAKKLDPWMLDLSNLNQEYKCLHLKVIFSMIILSECSTLAETRGPSYYPVPYWITIHIHHYLVYAGPVSNLPMVSTKPCGLGNLLSQLTSTFHPNVMEAQVKMGKICHTTPLMKLYPVPSCIVSFLLL